MRRAWVISLIGCLLMAGSVYGYVSFMKHTDIQVHTMEAIKPVRMLQSGEVLEASMLRKTVIPLEAHHPEAVSDVNALVGKTVVIPIADSEEITAWKLADKNLVPAEHERYFSFKADAVTNVGNMIRKGDRVDVWVEFDSPKVLTTPSGTNWSVGAVKIIESLPVYSVNTQEGAEVTDSGALEAVLPNRQQLQNARSKPNGKPELNTYIMNDEIYEAYVLGGIGGKMKLALPDLTASAVQPAKVTELFRELKTSGAFLKTKTQAVVNNEVKKNDVSGTETPKAVEVK